MLKIRAEQIEALRQPLLSRFEDEMVLHLNSAFEAEVHNRTEDDLRGLIRRGITKAESYEIVKSHDVSRYIEYMVCYGEAFDQDAQLPWAGRILQDQSLDGTAKMNRLDTQDRLNH